MNMGEMEYRIDKIWKITRKKMGMDDKMGHFRWIAGFIVLASENTIWVEGGSNVTSQKIEKNTLTLRPRHGGY